MGMEDGLSTEIVQWLNVNEPDYKNIFSEGLLIIPIAKYFRDQGFEVKGDTDYHFHRLENEPGKRGQANFDFYAKKGNGTPNELILEMKWLKAKTENKRESLNYPGIVTDFVKLAVPQKNYSYRLAVVARDPDVPPLYGYKWFSQLIDEKKLELWVGRNDQARSAILNPEPIFDDKNKKERERIFDLLAAYKIQDLELEIVPLHRKVSNNSVTVLVFSVVRKSSTPAL